MNNYTCRSRTPKIQESFIKDEKKIFEKSFNLYYRIKIKKI